MILLRTIIKAIVIIFLVFCSLSFLFTMNTTMAGIELYSSSTQGEHDDFLTEGAFFEYSYTGDQYGMGLWEDYHWWFRETGVLRITEVEEDLVQGVLNYTREEEDNEYYYYKYTCYVEFTYNTTNNLYIERKTVTDNSGTKNYTEIYSGQWFYHKENMSSTILNTSFSFSKKSIRIYEVPINVLAGHREGLISYVEDSITFYGWVSEDYYFDKKSGVLLKYTIDYPSMWDQFGNVGWSYSDEYIITRTNVKLAVNVDELLAQIFPVIIVLKTQLWTLLFMVLMFGAVFMDSYITKWKFSKTIKNMISFSTPGIVTELSPVNIELFNNGWLSDSFVVFKRGTKSHVLVNLSKNKQYALDDKETYALEKLLSFVQLDDTDIAVLNSINEKYNCIELGQAARIDPALIRKLKRLSKRHEKKVAKKIPSPESRKLLKLAFDVMGYRKVLSEMFGQAYALPPYNAFRAWKIHEKVGIGHILLIGDDDFLSILLAKLGINVTVIDIDPYVLRLIRFLSQKYRLEDRITLFYHDIRTPFTLPTRFSAVHMDPGYSLDGLMLFLSRGIQFLRSWGYLFVSWNSKDPNNIFIEKALQLHDIDMVEKINAKIKYLIPVAGYYAHYYSKYGTYSTFVPPTIRIGSWDAAFYIGVLKEAPNFLVDPNFVYTGVLY